MHARSAFPRFVCLVVVTAASVTGSAVLTAQGSGAGRAEIVFSRDILPILADRCFTCHGPDGAKRKGGPKGGNGMRLDTARGSRADLGGHHAVVPGRPEASELMRRIRATDGDRMPPKKTGKALSPGEISKLEQWIREGAGYAKFWAFVKPARPELPEVRDGSWPRSPIDRFVAAVLDREGIRPSPAAARTTLIRRVSLDLTGLPPALADVDRFVEDRDPHAYDKLVDRLLASPQFGEHFARHWLDLARYADTAGYADDPRRTIWSYRDWVIRALNANLPFDEFTVDQIAGDLLPHPTDDQLIATAFHRNTMTNNEGGTDDEEFRSVAIVDRVSTTMSVWMGTTMACAQCHDHKFDPLTQKEFFRLYAFFNTSQDSDKKDERPYLRLFSGKQKLARARLQAEREQLRRTLAADCRSIAAELQPARTRLVAVESSLAGIEPATTVPIMREQPSNARRQTRIQIRGNFRQTGAVVTAGVPAVFPPLASGVPRDRLALARWLVSPDNPLTARVAVNRYWEALFGRGIVATSEDFGIRGERPAHPELLDWLATEFVASGWNVKHLIRAIVTSATYRQRSTASVARRERDPANRLLARGPRLRLSAEMIRDQALAASGLLSPRMFGPPVRPPRPSLGLRAAFGGSTDWKDSEGADRYRRGIYTFWQRSIPYPSMAAFDAPSREVCTVHRQLTNTPLQALVTLNDPVYVEAAQVLGRRMAAHGTSTESRAAYGFRRCLARPPSRREQARLVAMFDHARKRYAADPTAAQLMATQPLGPVQKGADVIEFAAWTVVANVLLNLDEVLVKR